MSPFLTTLGGGSARGFGHAFRRSTTVAAPGQMAYTTVGNYYFTVPAGVTSLSMVCIGGGGGAGYGGGNGGLYGGAGGSGGVFIDLYAVVAFGVPGSSADGAVRIIWGTGRSYPSAAANV